MATPELDYKRRVLEALIFHSWQVQEHEDKQSNFIADVSFSANRADGWIEVKYCEEAPVSLGAIPHWTRGQEGWLFDRGRVGSGHCYLLVGTPEGNFLWRYDVLSTVRNQSFSSALQYAMIRERDIFGLAGEMNLQIVSRARVPGGRGPGAG